jgi:hypothetical protein
LEYFGPDGEGQELALGAYDLPAFQLRRSTGVELSVALIPPKP